MVIQATKALYCRRLIPAFHSGVNRTVEAPKEPGVSTSQAPRLGPSIGIVPAAAAGIKRPLALVEDGGFGPIIEQPSWRDLNRPSETFNGAEKRAFMDGH
jgi:hypothetical protein